MSIGELVGLEGGARLLLLALGTHKGWGNIGLKSMIVEQCV
jgi:hypothetical protein